MGRPCASSSSPEVSARRRPGELAANGSPYSPTGCYEVDCPHPFIHLFIQSVSFGIAWFLLSVDCFFCVNPCIVFSVCVVFTVCIFGIVCIVCLSFCLTFCLTFCLASCLTSFIASCRTSYRTSYRTLCLTLCLGLCLRLVFVFALFCLSWSF